MLEAAFNIEMKSKLERRRPLRSPSDRFLSLLPLCDRKGICMASNGGFIGVNNDTSFPTIHIVSDSLGATAHSLARAAAGQFGYSEPIH